MPYKSTNKFTLYTITCLVNDKTYVGVAAVYERRVNQHKRLLESGKHRSVSLQQDFNIYGGSKFAYDVVSEYSSEIEAYRQEKYYTDYIFCLNKELCYNTYTGGMPHFTYGNNVKPSVTCIENSKIYAKNNKQSAETRKKRSISSKGRIFTDDERKKLSETAWCSKKVIDVSTNKVYRSLVEASGDYPDVKVDTLRSWLNHQNRNKTNLKWL